MTDEKVLRLITHFEGSLITSDLFTMPGYYYVSIFTTLEIYYCSALSTCIDHFETTLDQHE